jgi:Zn-dependent protease
MVTDFLNSPLTILLWFAALVVSITVHEFAHAFAADRLGDPTPSLQGRLTLNPRAHLDPIGTLMILFIHFGWGKPVQFDPFNLRNPRRDAAVISLAGPAANLIMAVISSAMLRLITSLFFVSQTGILVLLLPVLASFLYTMIILNITLAIFNLIPVHPLDGFKIVGGFLPEQSARQWQELESYGLIFLIFLILPLSGGISPLSRIIQPATEIFLKLLLPAVPLI